MNHASSTPSTFSLPHPTFPKHCACTQGFRNWKNKHPTVPYAAAGYVNGYPPGSRGKGGMAEKAHVSSNDPLLCAKQVEAVIVGRRWAPGMLHTRRKGWVLTREETEFARGTRALLGLPPGHSDDMLKEWPNPRQPGQMLQGVKVGDWAEAHLAEALEFNFVTLQLVELVNLVVLRTTRYAAGRLPIFDILPTASIARYWITLDTEVRWRASWRAVALRAFPGSAVAAAAAGASRLMSEACLREAG